jgi:cholesterol oxidase
VAGHFEALDPGRRRFGAPPLFVSADVVVLAAGALGSTEILLRSRERGLPLSERLGEHFSGNADVLGFAYDTAEEINGVGVVAARHRRRAGAHASAGIIDLRDVPARGGHGHRGGLHPQRAGAPARTTFAAVAAALGPRAPAQLADPAPGGATPWTEALYPAPHRGALRRHPDVPGDGPRRCRGRLQLDGDRLRIAWPGVGRQEVFARVNARLAEAAQRRRRAGTCATPSGPSGSTTGS